MKLDGLTQRTHGQVLEGVREILEGAATQSEADDAKAEQAAVACAFRFGAVQNMAHLRRLAGVLRHPAGINSLVWRFTRAGLVTDFDVLQTVFEFVDPEVDMGGTAINELRDRQGLLRCAPDDPGVRAATDGEEESLCGRGHPSAWRPHGRRCAGVFRG